MNTDKHRFYWPKNQREKTEGDTDEHGYTRIIAEEKNRNGKTVLQLSKTPVPKADFCSQAIPEIPPLPPFSKGGLGGFQRGVSHPNMLSKI
jgi:hypothetical protein